MDAALRLTNLNVPEDEGNTPTLNEGSISRSTNSKHSTRNKKAKGNPKSEKTVKERKKSVSSPVCPARQNGAILNSATEVVQNVPLFNGIATTVNKSTQNQNLQPKECKPTVPVVTEPTTTSSNAIAPSSRSGKRRKKKKKHKNSSAHLSADPPTVVDPLMQSALKQLCKQLDRFAISRSTASQGSCASKKNQSKKVPMPWVFQCRKYSASAAANSDCISGATATTSSRAGKRKKADEVTCAATSTATSSSTVSTKRRGKSKKNASSHQSIPPSAPIKPEPISNAAIVLSAVELLLPLKKRHHHLAASESPAIEAADPCEIVRTDSGQSDNVESGGKAPSGEHHRLPASATIQQQTNPTSVHNKKRPASSKESSSGGGKTGRLKESPAESAIINDKQVNKQKRGRKTLTAVAPKKSKLEPITEAIESETLKSINIVSDPEPVIPKQVEQQILMAETKKKNRRRKTFNRTGFPSVKRKRKKPSTPLPKLEDKLTASSEASLNNCWSSDTNSAATGGRHAKRARLMPKEDDSEDGLLPEPTSSESPSGDELATNPSVPLPTTVKPKKRKRSAAPNFKKSFLTAGLLSNFFKTDVPDSTAPAEKPEGRVKVVTTYDPAEHEYGLLPAPFYCERVLRRVRRDYQLPFDLWWLHQEDKLPGRDTMTTVPSWNYRKIRSNVYYDVKPPFTNDAQSCDCTFPPPDANGKLKNVHRTISIN